MNSMILISCSFYLLILTTIVSGVKEPNNKPVNDKLLKGKRESASGTYVSHPSNSYLPPTKGYLSPSNSYLPPPSKAYLTPSKTYFSPQSISSGGKFGGGLGGNSGHGESTYIIAQDIGGSDGGYGFGGKGISTGRHIGGGGFGRHYGSAGVGGGYGGGLHTQTLTIPSHHHGLTEGLHSASLGGFGGHGGLFSGGGSSPAHETTYIIASPSYGNGGYSSGGHSIDLSSLGGGSLGHSLGGGNYAALSLDGGHGGLFGKHSLGGGGAGPALSYAQFQSFGSGHPIASHGFGFNDLSSHGYGIQELGGGLGGGLEGHSIAAIAVPSNTYGTPLGSPISSYTPTTYQIETSHTGSGNGGVYQSPSYAAGHKGLRHYQSSNGVQHTVLESKPVAISESSYIPTGRSKAPFRPSAFLGATHESSPAPAHSYASQTYGAPSAHGSYSGSGVSTLSHEYEVPVQQIQYVYEPAASSGGSIESGNISKGNSGVASVQYLPPSKTYLPAHSEKTAYAIPAATYGAPSGSGSSGSSGHSSGYESQNYNTVQYSSGGQSHSSHH